jgi:CheY-specific phosphatase CheX
MTNTTANFNTAEHIGEIVPNVFDTMLGLRAATTTASLETPPERVSGAIGIAGETVTGTVYIHLPEPLAREITRAMLQCTAGQDAGDSDVNDVVGELSNMIGCGLKSRLNDADIVCAVSTPSAIRGAFAVEPPPGVRAEKFHFACLGARFAVEVHLQLN